MRHRSHRRRLVHALVGVALTLSLAACSSGDATDVTAAADGVRVADAASVAELLAAEPERVVLDVRTPAEFAEGHLEGAVLIDYNAPDFAEQVATLDPEASYVLYCRSGNRSAGARAVLTEQGFVDAVDVEGGIVAWQQAGLPVVAG